MAQSPNVKTWDFTAWGENDDHTPVMDEIKNDCVHWAFQLEITPTTGKKHWQGRIQLRRQQRITGLLKLFPVLASMTVHYTPTANVNKHKFNYVVKRETRLLGPWTSADVPPPLMTREVKLLEEKGLRPWQDTVVKGMKETPHPRQVNVIYDEAGGIGKGSLGAYLRYHKLATTVPPICDVKQVMGFCMDFTSTAFLFDVPRALKDKDYKQLYATIEMVKDGYLWDVRNKGRTVTIERPHVWVFTNTMPMTSWLSPDRWALWGVHDGKLVSLKGRKRSAGAAQDESPQKKSALRASTASALRASDGAPPQTPGEGAPSSL